MNFLLWILATIASTILFVINLVLDIVLSMLGLKDKKNGKGSKSRGKRK